MKSACLIIALIFVASARFHSDPPPSPYYPKYQFAGDHLFISGANGADSTGTIKGDVYDQTI